MRTTRSRESRHVLGWGLLVGVLATLAGIFLYLLVSSIGDDDPPVNQAAMPGVPPAVRVVTPTPTPTPIPTASAPTPPSVRPTPGRPAPPPPRYRGVDITSPADRQGVRGEQGVLITGTAGDLAGRSLRVFDLADNGLYYLVDHGPLTIRDGRWSLRYQDIGEGQDDVGNVFTMTAVAADASCQRVLESVRPDGEGDRPFRELPPGCRVLDQVPVVKIAP